MESSDDGEGSQEFVEILRCVRGDEARSYRLRAVAGGAELWRVTHSGSGGPHSIKECDFQSPDEAAGFLEELRRSLIAGGWQQR